VYNRRVLKLKQLTDATGDSQHLSSPADQTDLEVVSDKNDQFTFTS